MQREIQDDIIAIGEESQLSGIQTNKPRRECDSLRGFLCAYVAHGAGLVTPRAIEERLATCRHIIGGYACRDTLQEESQVHSILSPLPVASLGWSNTGIIPYRGDKKNYGMGNFSIALGVISSKNAR